MYPALKPWSPPTPSLLGFSQKAILKGWFSNPHWGLGAGVYNGSSTHGVSEQPCSMWRVLCRAPWLYRPTYLRPMPVRNVYFGSMDKLSAGIYGAVGLGAFTTTYSGAANPRPPPSPTRTGRYVQRLAPTYAATESYSLGSTSSVTSWSSATHLTQAGSTTLKPFAQHRAQQ